MKYPEPEKCLIVGPSWVGDMVMAQSLFIDLKQRYPDMIIDVLAPSWSKALLASMPQIRNALNLPFKHGELGLFKRIKLGRSLRKEQYDWAIVLPNSLKSAIPVYSANIPRRTGFKGEIRYGLLNDIRILDKNRLTMTVQRFVALGKDKQDKYDGSYLSPDMQTSDEIIKSTLAAFQLDPQKPVLALCPGAEYGSAKRWPEEYYAQVAQAISEKDVQIVILGSEKDQSVTAKIESKITELASNPNTKIYNLAGKTSIEQVIALLQHSNYAVSNDSGLMHVAAAVGTPLVALYGSSDPGFTPPLSRKATILDLHLPCSPCFKRECPLGTLACLKDIKPEEVINILSADFQTA